ncbi:MAG TPA: glycogen synthase GlgA [Candidatus Pullichristensenella excrementigallinarum]|uniref:Glycogen synthase n=1 Tax=Candidatus Pullichristensenella excrementigallinarum TaxID=2840907 RepID=A0A9D1IC83_9FIRM|nr:glycogen synthase GlgA [Candidatus Pullichristensenella excrementigallinarum]
MKVLFVASECMPFVKTGGLADVVGALPKRIRESGADVRVMLPLYSAIDTKWREKMEHVLFFYINLGWRRQYVGIEKLELDGVTFYFVDNEQYFGRNYIYGYGSEEGERFAFFCRAVLEALPHIDFMPDVLNCHDWQTGMIPVMLEIQYRHKEAYKNIRTVFTIHNLQYQGIFQIGEIEEMLSLGDLAYTSDALEFYGMCSFIKGGIVFSERVTTVSPTYAEEIQTAYYGERLDGLLRARADNLTGILNGIDTDEYNPQTDPMIYKNYSADTFADKRENKLALQREMGLLEDPDAPLIGMVGRLNGQKGLDLVERVLGEIMATGAQMVVLGMGDNKYVDLFNWAQWKYSGQLAACFQMNHQLSHRIYAGADMFLMPSMFEPCGLSQMISLRYGTLPITRETGGLRDTVLSYNEYTGDGNGFTFLNYNAHDMLHVIERAISIYREEKPVWEKLATRAMRGSYGWDESAKKYLALYEELVKSPRGNEEKPPRKEKARKSAKKAEEKTEEYRQPDHKALVKLLGKDVAKKWDAITQCVEKNYDCESAFAPGGKNGVHECKFKKGGRSLATLYAKEGEFCVQIALGKAEREKFEAAQADFSEKLRQTYENAPAHRDGKMLTLSGMDTQEGELLQILSLKRKPKKEKA